MKKIVIAPDSFKGSLDAARAARAIAQGIHIAAPDILTAEVPVADGGEGTLDALTDKSCRASVATFNTEGEPIIAEFGFIGETAVIESAQAVGLGTIPVQRRRPYNSTTRGVGALMSAALDRGFRKILLTVGGTGCNDGGAGMLEALGVVFYGKDGQLCGIRARDLCRVTDIDISGIDPRLYDTQITIACDVTNPLTGKNGATYVYGAQKGADAKMLERLEAGMQNYASKLAVISRNASDIPGVGAGGGLPFPLLSLFDARICPGISAVLEAVGFDRILDGAGLVITGEGKIDFQSAFGKAISGVAAAAAAHGIPVVALVGQIGAGADEMLRHGVSAIYAIADIAPDTDYAISHAAELLTRLASEVCKKYL